MDYNIDDVLARINLCIEKKGWTKEDFYAKSGITSASFSQWHTGRHNPTKKKLMQAADCLDVSLEYLLFGKIENPAQTDGIEEYAKVIRALCGEKIEILRQVSDALAKEPEKTKAKFDLFLKTL